MTPLLIDPNKAEGAAHDIGLAADAQRAGIAEYRRRERRALDGRLEDRDVLLRLLRHDPGGRDGAIGERDEDLRRLRDDVERGQDVAAIVDDHATAELIVVGDGGVALRLDDHERGQDPGVRRSGQGRTRRL